MASKLGFRRYDHLERSGHRDVEGIYHGECFVFPKLDGANSSVWWWGDEGVLSASRNRVLTIENDNAGFCRWVQEGEHRIQHMARDWPQWIFYGEWLVPHTVKDYREECWRRFWIFDVWDRGAQLYVPFPIYEEVLAKYGADYIPPACTVQDPDAAQLFDMLDHNFYLMQDGRGPGEGIVVKNYNWTNRHGKQPWAKMVRSAPKEASAKEFGYGERKGRKQVEIEIEIADEVVTEHLVRKELAKVIVALHSEKWDEINEHCEKLDDASTEAYILVNYRKRVIPWILSQAYNCVIEEELWDQLKKHRNPTIDFKALQGRVTFNVKKHLPELF